MATEALENLLAGASERASLWHRLYRTSEEAAHLLREENTLLRGQMQSEVQRLTRLVDVLRERTENSMDKAVADEIEAENRDLRTALKAMLDYAQEGARHIEGDRQREEWYAARDFARATLARATEDYSGD